MPTKKATKTTASKKSVTAKKVPAQKKTETLTKSKTAQKPATSAAKKKAPKTKPNTKTPTKKPAIVKKNSAVRKPVATKKPLPSSINPGSGSASSVPQEIIDFLEEFDALKSGKTWAAKAAALINTIPAAMFDDFSDALDLATPLSSGKIPAQLLAARPTKPVTKSGKGTITQVRPTLKTFGTAILGNKIGRDELSELVERLRCCICCCHCWPCRPWPFCRICCRRLIKVSSTQDTGWVYHLKFNNAAAAIANRVADITCPSGGSTGGPWAPKDWTTAAPADAPIGYAPANHNHDTDYADSDHNHNSDYADIDHDHDTDYSASDHDHNDRYAPKFSGTPATLIRYAEIDAPDNTAKTVKLRDKATSPALTEVTVSLASHKHDTDYANAEHDHDTDYAAIDHDHDADYAPLSGSANYAAAGHNHNTAYSAIGHNHDADYAAIDHDHDADYAAASHDNDSHSTKFFSRINLITKINPDTSYDGTNWYVKIQLNLPVGFNPGTSNWSECISAVYIDQTLTYPAENLKVLDPSIVIEQEGGVDVNKLKFRLENSSGTVYRKNNGIWDGRFTLVSIAAPATD